MTKLVLWLGAWVCIGAAWLVVMPRETRAKAWHYTHSAIPSIVLLLFPLSPEPLRGAAELYLLTGAVILVLLLATWMIGQARHNHSVMDIAYPLVVVIVTMFAFMHAPAESRVHATVLLALVVLWGVRLLSHTLRTNLRVEQQPYAGLRARFGKRWPLWSLFSVYLLQGTMLWIFCASIVFAMSAPQARFGVLDACGTAVWIVGFLFQTVGDWQLKQFKSDAANKGRLMQRGLWNLTRHPNYFGETLMWWGYFLFALQHPWGWLAVIGAAYTHWFMAYGSAIPGNERHMRKTRPEYEEYASRVPRFWPRLTTRS